MPETVQFVAEVSSNHNQDLDRCLAFIDCGAKIGCNAVKFQLFRVRELFAPEILDRSEKHRMRERWELPCEFLPKLAGRCRERGVLFSCTPFYLAAVAELEPYTAFYKIASYELTWDALLDACARTGKPVVLSTGMATMEEVGRAVGVLRAAGCRDLKLLHCVSGYPCPAADCNLSAIASLRAAFAPAAVGWSDHSVNSGVLRRAVRRWKAEMIEFHMDLEGDGAEFKAGHCWLPGQIAPLITELQHGAEADADQTCQPMDGDGRKEPVPSELSDRAWRRDPVDGLRPFQAIRKTWRG